MVNANELRHNNKYYFSGNSEGLFDYENIIGTLKVNDGFEFYVEFSDISNGKLSEFTGEQIKPIPLTPDILVKCGFIKWMGQDTFEIEFEDYNTIQITGNKVFLGGGASCIEGHGFNLVVDFVHQLQNLYFALTGKELPITL